MGQELGVYEEVQMNNNYCKNCNELLGKRRYPVWETPNGPAHVCSQKCLAEINGEDYTASRRVKNTKSRNRWDNDE